MFHLNTTTSQMFQIKATPQIKNQFLWDMTMINVYFVISIVAPCILETLNLLHTNKCIDVL